MAQQRFFESDEDFRRRAKHEALEEASGLTQRFWESDEDFEKRASSAALVNISGLTQHFWESDEDFEKRASGIALENMSGTHQHLFETEESFYQRASEEALKKASDTTPGLFESDEMYQNRAMASLASSLHGVRAHVYLHERKRTDMKSTDEVKISTNFQSTSHSSHPANSSYTPKRHPIIGGVIGYFAGGTIAGILNIVIDNSAIKWGVVVVAVIVGILAGYFYDS